MLNRVSALILAVMMFLIFQGSTASLSVLAVGLVLFIAFSFAVNYKRIGASYPHLILPCFYLLGMGGVFALLTNSTIRFIFLILSVIVFYFIEKQLGRESHFLQNVYLLSVFAIFVDLFALQFYFHLNFLIIAALMFLLAYALIIQGFAGFSLPVKKHFSILIALSCAEVALGLVFWPTYFVVDGIVAFAVFYVLWIFSFSAFFGKLSRQKIYWQLSLVFIVLAVTIISANFRPLTR